MLMRHVGRLLFSWCESSFRRRWEELFLVRRSTSICVSLTAKPLKRLKLQRMSDKNVELWKKSRACVLARAETAAQLTDLSVLDPTEPMLHLSSARSQSDGVKFGAASLSCVPAGLKERSLFRGVATRPSTSFTTALHFLKCSCRGTAGGSHFEVVGRAQTPL